MEPTNETYLESFPHWLASLGSDAQEILPCLEDVNVASPAKLLLAGGLNYLLKSLDLIPDGVENLGYLDDAMVLRIAARLVWQDHESLWKEDESKAILARLNTEATTAVEFLGKLYPRLEDYVRNLSTGAARGRTAQEIVENQQTRAVFNEDIRAWARDYQAPAFERDMGVLLQFTSFLETKLPR